MRSTVRKFFLTPAVMVAAALTTSAAMAATPLNVPFSFSVAGKDCPAGRYIVERDLQGNMVTLRSPDSVRTFIWALRPGDPAPTDTRVILTFDTLGSVHALQSVQYGSKATPRLDKRMRSKEYAANPHYLTSQIVAGQ